jgi:hypothetical protein
MDDGSSSCAHGIHSYRCSAEGLGRLGQRAGLMPYAQIATTYSCHLMPRHTARSGAKPRPALIAPTGNGNFDCQLAPVRLPTRTGSTANSSQLAPVRLPTHTGSRAGSAPWSAGNGRGTRHLSCLRPIKSLGLGCAMCVTRPHPSPSSASASGCAGLTSAPGPAPGLAPCPAARHTRLLRRSTPRRARERESWSWQQGTVSKAILATAGTSWQAGTEGYPSVPAWMPRPPSPRTLPEHKGDTRRKRSKVQEEEEDLNQEQNSRK